MILCKQMKNNEKNENKITAWNFDNNLLNDKTFLKELEEKMKFLMVKHSPASFDHRICLNYINEHRTIKAVNYGFYKYLPLNKDQKGRLKNNKLSCLELVYLILDTVKCIQSERKTKAYNKFKKSKDQRLKRFAVLHAKMRTLSKIEILELRHLNMVHSNAMYEQMAKKAVRANLNYNALGNQASAYFLRLAQNKRLKCKVDNLEIDGVYCDNIEQINRHLHDTYTEVLQQPDNYIEGTLENFLGPEGLKRLGGITDTDKEELDSNFNLSEVGEAIKKINSTSCAGPDGISGRLLKHIFNLAPNLIVGATNDIAFNNDIKPIEFLTLSLILIPKPNSSKKKLQETTAHLVTFEFTKA
jgi:hypothetical protein